MARLRSRGTWWGLLAAACAAGALAPVARAGFDVPDPTRSTVPACVLSCPDGDLAYTVVVRFTNGMPVAGAVVQLDFSNCPVWTRCPPPPNPPSPEVYDDSHSIVAGVAGADGSVTFHLLLGAVCPSGLVRVYADGLLMGAAALTSTDQTGDLSVGAADFALASGKLGTGDRTADFDCDGTVTPADLAILQAHFGHVCQVAVRNRPSTWGDLKLYYR